MLYPVLEMSDGEQDALGLLPCPRPLLAETFEEGLLLLVGLEFGQQEGVSHADLLGIERLHHWLGKLGEPDALGDIGRRLSCLGRDLLDAVLRLLQVEQGAKSLRLLQWMNVAPLQVLDLSLVLQRLSMTSTTMESCTLWNAYL